MIMGCVIGGLMVVVMIGSVAYLIAQSGERDPISAAREGWIQRRSEKDNQGW
ncbi:MAG TPA: hypothetical protein PKD98_02480 [Anaerolineae bacterium]|nr:hypothetical protein [Anaerolineae bacterium]